MRILQIDSCCNKLSTGKIAEGIGKEIIKAGGESYIAYGRYANKSQSTRIRIGNSIDVIWHVLLTRLFDKHGFGSTRATKEFLDKVSEIKPDIIHLHDIHGYYINIELLFRFIKEKNIPVVWTHHCCWAFTGHCAYFENIGCDKWKTLCHNCPLLKEYPASYLVDRSAKNYEIKRALFTSINLIRNVTVSKWLERFIAESFLNKYRSQTIYNGVDTKIFKRKENIIKDKYKIGRKFLILGVAAQWTQRKGFKDIIELSNYIDKEMIIILVGVNKKQLSNLPKNIIGVPRIDDSKELADYYSSADIFFNPTWEDSFPTTNLESLACGTPVLTYDTGGSPESVDENTGFVIRKGDLNETLKVFNKVKKLGKDYYKDICRKRAIEKFKQEDRFKEYIDIYSELIDINQVRNRTIIQCTP